MGRKPSIIVTHNGRSMSIPEWARETGLSPVLIASRLELGWPVDRALTTPPQRRNHTSGKAGSGLIEDVSSRERSLWVAVITQAIADARCSANTGSTYARMEVLRAREWFTKRNKDFQTVCDLAGLEPDWVRKLAVKEITQAIAKDAQLESIEKAA